ncbi:MAG: OmpH family outer membrane protein [Verrucomicrobiales bacterium]|jgi:Skp family chaperone for outer membrane proteins|nr:OmpH family outer membrane protein [Verrucomicrobiales bacterium]
MKRIIVSVLFAFSLIGGSLKAADLKIATIDVQDVFKNYYKTAEAEKQLQVTAASNKTQVDGIMTDYNKLREQASALQNELTTDATSSETAKKAKTEKLKDLFGELQKKEQEVKTTVTQLERFMQDQQLRERKRIVEEITKTIETYSKGKYTIVLDKTGINLNGTPTLLYSEGVTDITAEVLKQLNAAKPAAK